MAVRVNKESFYEEVLMAKVPVVAEFYSESCNPCKQMAATLGVLEDEYQSKIKIVKVNVNFSAELAKEYRVRSAPTVLFFESEKEVRRINGLVEKPVLQGIIENILKSPGGLIK